jgi:hypothetical protein
MDSKVNFKHQFFKNNLNEKGSKKQFFITIKNIDSHHMIFLPAKCMVF